MPCVQRGKGTAISMCLQPGGDCSLLAPKENQKSASDFDALEPRTRGCSPLVTPKQKSKRKNASRFAKRIFSFLRFEGPSAAAAAAPRGGAGCALSVTFGDTLSPFCRCATSSPDRGKSFKGRGKKRSHHALGSPFGGAGAKRLRGFTPRRGAGSPLARCSRREPAAADAVCRYDSSREKTKKKSPQAFLFCKLKIIFPL